MCSNGKYLSEMVKNILITGGASGLGKSIIEELTQLQGIQIWFTYCKSNEEAMKLESKYPNVHSLYCDFNSTESMNQCFQFLEEIQIDCLINNAYVGPLKEVHFHNLEIQTIQNSFSVNVLPVLEMTQCMILKFRKQQYGKIITILSSSILSLPNIGWSIYNAEKNYLLSMAKSWAVENAKFNIVSNCISPTFMETNIHDHRDPYLLEMTKSKIGKILTTKECAEVVTSMVLTNHHVNGVNLPINGGVK